MSPVEDPALPRIPERFRVLGRLGQGGMATVYLAEDTVAGAQVALKILHAHLHADELVRERFRREIAAARRITHPNVIAIHDLVVAPGCVALVMEHHPGVDLKRRLRQEGPMAPERAVALTRQVLAGLDAAHQHGIVHRDLKPQNILCDDRGVVKLTDFGLARVDDLVGLTTHTMTLGTPEYMAPELLSTSVVDGRADLYSVGVTLYELVTGKLPYRASSPLALLRMHEAEPVPDPGPLVPGLPESVREAIVRALAKDPEDRFQTAAEMARALEVGALVRAAAGTPAARCRRCAAPLLPGVSGCVECGHEPIRIASHRAGRHRVRIPRSGRFWSRGVSRHDTLTFEQKHALVEELRTLGGDLTLSTEKLDAHLRLLPVVAAAELTLGDAERLAARLGDLGVPARISRRGLVDVLRFMTPSHVWGRAFLNWLAAAILCGLFDAFGLPAFVIPFLLLGVPLLTLVVLVRRRLKPIARFSGREGGRPSEDGVVARAVQTFARVRSPRLRAILRRTLARGLDVRRQAGAAGVDGAALAGVDALLLGALAQAERVAALEADVAALDPAVVYEEIKALDERIATARSADETEPLIAKKTRLVSELERVGELERDIVHGTGELLALSARLSEAGTTLAGAGPGEQPSQLALSVLVKDLTAQLQARADVEKLD